MNTTMRGLLEKRANENPDKYYAFFEPDVKITYGEFDQTVNRVANSLLKWGIRKGDMVGLFLKNCPEFLYAYFAIAKIGAIMVPMNFGYPAEELTYAVNHSQMKLLLASDHLAKVVEESLPDCRELKEVVFTGHRTDRFRTFNEFIDNASSSLEKTNVTPDDVVSVCYTSGTTARPKGVMLTQRSYLLAGEFWGGSMECTPSDRLMGFFPLFHANVGIYIVMSAMLYNASAIILETLSMKQHWEKVRKYGATEFNTTGSILAMMLSQPEMPDDRDNPVRVIMNGINAGSIKEEFEKRFDLKILDGYALTEFLAAAMERLGDLPTRHPGRIFTMGRTAERTELKMVSDDGEDVPTGQSGEILLKGPSMLKGYWKDPEATAKAITDGWFHTGDNGRCDKEGFIYFVDRKKDMIKRRGENIASGEVERVLNSHPKIQESAVIGIPDIYADEEVKAFIILKPGETLPPEEIIDFCLDYLEPFKAPRYIEFRDSFPRPAAVAKILKTELRTEKSDPARCYDRGQKLPKKKTNV
jgi:crotonobetaine/carnitine-CoA ligase